MLLLVLPFLFFSQCLLSCVVERDVEVSGALFLLPVRLRLVWDCAATHYAFKSMILNFKGDLEGGERSVENWFCLSMKMAVPKMISKCHFSSLEIDNTL